MLSLNSPFRAAPAANRQVRSGDDGAKPRPARLGRADARGECGTGWLPAFAGAPLGLPCDYETDGLEQSRGRDIPREAAAAAAAAARGVLLRKKGWVGAL